jgi:hypothetical protein
VHVTGGEVAPGRGNAYLRLPEIVIVKTYRSQHGPACGLANTIYHGGRITATLIIGHRKLLNTDLSDFAIIDNVMDSECQKKRHASTDDIDQHLLNRSQHTKRFISGVSFKGKRACGPY